MKRYLLLLSILIGSTVIDAQNVDANVIVGVWKSPGDNYMIKIDKVGSTFQGRIVWLDESVDQMILDKHNPNEHLKKLPLKGNKIITDLVFDDQGQKWTSGNFYNFDEGKTYHCEITLQSPQTIQILKYTGSVLDGTKETWHRQ